MKVNVAEGSFVSFESKVNGFIASIDLQDLDLERRLIKEIIRYVLKIPSQNKKISFVLKKAFSVIGLRNEIDQFQTEYLNISYYLLRVLYPAIIDHVYKRKRFNVLLTRDITFCLSFFEASEIEVFKELTKEVDTTRQPSFSVGIAWLKDYKILKNYIRSKLHNFHILLCNDPALDIEDYSQEILIAIIKLYNNNPIAFQNRKYVDAMITNQIKTLINYYTRGKRRRINSIYADQYDKMKSLKRKMKDNPKNATKYEKEIGIIKSGIQTSSDDYYATVVDFKKAQKAFALLTVEDTIEDKVFVKELLNKVADRKLIREYFQILLDSNPLFETWLEADGKTVNSFDCLCKYAKMYLEKKYGYIPANVGEKTLNSLDLRNVLYNAK